MERRERTGTDPQPVTPWQISGIVFGLAVYVIAWEIVYWGFIPDFGDKFAAITLEKMKANGATPEAMVKAEAEMARFKELYKNPLFNVGITFLEIFPVGLIVTLVSAAILRKKAPGAPAVATA